MIPNAPAYLMLAINTPASRGPLACPISPMVPCMPIPAPNVLNSELSATNAEEDEETTASPNPNPAESTSNMASSDTCGIETNVAAHISSPNMIKGCRPMRSETRPILGFEMNDVRDWTVNKSPTSPALRPTEMP